MVTSVFVKLGDRRTRDAQSPARASRTTQCRGSQVVVVPTTTTSTRSPSERRMSRAEDRRPRLSVSRVAAACGLLSLLLVACCAGACRGAPRLPQGLWPDRELQLWNEIYDACSSFLTNSQPQASVAALRELCLTVMGTLPKPQEQYEKDNTKRFLFHYSKTQKLGNSNVVSSVVHPLLQLVPHLHDRRMKRFREDEEFQSPFASRSRGYFLFRPRNGRRSAAFI